ncbi:Transglutaminase-like superfamily protein [Epilithonimonas hungarica]|uniref:Transglutaminase-like superfamily protein n=2 Tax=Epilithonimonas hungarica TaxID=454006 RepID=A0A1G7HEA3_9FLAO|nr:Transglutaminase-like superfamily protein [Epilithonimonas hungarica]
MFSQNYGITNIPAELLKNADVVYRNYEQKSVVNSVSQVDTHFTKVVTIMNKAGDDYAALKIPYDKTNKVSDIKVRTFDALGRLSKTYSKKDFSDYSATEGFELYTEARILYLKIISTTYPYTIELNYDEESSDTAFLNPFFTFYGYNVAIENSSYSFENKSGIKLRSNIKNTDYGKITLQGDDNNFSLSYNKIPAIVEEKYAPNPITLMPRAEFALDNFTLKGKRGDMSNWQNFGKWYNELLEPASKITPEIQQEVNSLNLKGTTEEKIKTIYQYMQNKTRYVFVALGIGGWQPMLAEDVRKKSYGDCKALTNYMRVLLKAAGIPSYYSVIYMDETPKLFDKDFPRMDGNHVILCVPTENGNIWLENTSQRIAYNHLSYRTTDRNVVMVKENTAEIVDTPKSITENNKEVLRIKANISADNNLDVTSRFSYSGGLYDMSMPILSLTPIEQKDALKHRYDNLQFSNIDIQNLVNDRDKAIINFDFNFKAANYSKSLGSDIYFRAIPFIDSDFYLEDSERKLPIEIPFGFTDDYEIEYTIPDNYKFAENPTPAKIDSEFGSFSMEFINQDKKLLVKRKFMLKKGVFPADKISDYIKFRKQANKIDHTKILITKI